MEVLKLVWEELSGGIFGVIREDMPEYEVIEKKSNFEIRQYGPAIVAESSFQGKIGEMREQSKAFWALAGYIGVLEEPKNVRPGAREGTKAGAASGEAIPMTAPVVLQDAGEKIAMTSPVVLQEATEKIPMTAPIALGPQDDGASDEAPTVAVQFLLPSKYTMDTVPKPTNPQVTVKQLPGKRVGALVFNGTWNDGQIREKARKLKEDLGAASYRTVGNYMTAFYNSPACIPYFRRNEVWYELSVEK